ncbi:hypothetical protein WJ47_11165 [Burkholderia ubonensis]|uniref:Uncharacterized protein n=1 Tax=Burkholderia ubonensis TaxID=101571 RepID=A0AB73G328_9BURK|nr:hypothetical protein WJ44_28410 [Burkholderia ubonensis]KVL67630.1 hypothetical protein WJ47_11165 [Burkholderia ubonensis]KVM28582.1 hypothetical protein WJ54_12800 [Burkholderia ubonensis]KVM28585.1 hypothetical protein WJ53_08960 [Burkholderia ubonensis]
MITMIVLPGSPSPPITGVASLVESPSPIGTSSSPVLSQMSPIVGFCGATVSMITCHVSDGTDSLPAASRTTMLKS